MENNIKNIFKRHRNHRRNKRSQRLFLHFPRLGNGHNRYSLKFQRNFSPSKVDLQSAVYYHNRHLNTPLYFLQVFFFFNSLFLIFSGSFFDQHPYALPCIVSASFSFIGFLTGLFFLKETLGQKHEIGFK